jgi:hypothetical protein
MKPSTCPECGAPLPESGSCHDNFHALLYLEWQVEGGVGELAHFYAVSCYALQHPVSFNYTAVTLSNLHQSLTDVLDGRITLSQLRQRTRQAANGSTRITRRPHDDIPQWYDGSWPMNVSHVCAAGAAGYIEAAQLWAKSVRETLGNQVIG